MNHFAAHAVRHVRAIRGVVDVIDKLESRHDEVTTGDGYSPGPLF